MLMNWLSFTAKNDVVAVALIVALAVLGILFASLFLADRLRRRSRQKRGNDLYTKLLCQCLRERTTNGSCSVYKFALVFVKGAAFAFLAVASANASWQADCINPGICSTRICVATRELALWSAKRTAGGSRELERSGHQTARHAEALFR
jgi:hypothetical protein